MKSRLGLAFLLFVLARDPLHAQSSVQGTVTGVVTDSASHSPLENARVVLRAPTDSTRVYGSATGKDGRFAFAHLALGSYVLECSLIGHVSFRSAPFVLDEAHPSAVFPAVALKPATLLLNEVAISSERSRFDQGLDRRVYNVDHDVAAKSSTASDLLQNIPSVQVDVDGNVSLRGSSGVVILVNGKKSPLMGRNQSEVLQQLPASGIERIEVITNPSARFTPEGASGIINIVMKRSPGPGVSGDVTANLGEKGRENQNLALGGHPGKFDLFASYSHREDRRTRLGTDDRVLTGAGSARSYAEANEIRMRPYVHLGSLGLAYHATPKDEFDLSADYFRRRPSRGGSSTIVTRDGAGAALADYDRLETGYELERTAGVTTAFQHDFSKADRQLRIEANVSDSPQEEAVRFVDLWRVPAQPDAASDVLLRQSETQSHVTIDYHDHGRPDTKLEAGYALELHRQDIHSAADSLDVARQTFVPDPSRTYRFKLDQAIQSVYGTYQRTFGTLSVLGGLRAEHAIVSSDLITGKTGFTDRYAGLYPSLHIRYMARRQGEVQASYSRRIRRPESDDLNPFPEFTDPYNMEAGNPRLKPESIHSFELGYRLQTEHFTWMPSVYYRYKTNGFTRVTQALTDSTFLRTMVNLASDRAAGFEPVLTLSLGRALQGNLSANVFYEQLDASNLGYEGRKSVVSWSGMGNLNVTPRPATMLQANANYTSARLTPQGQGRPSFVLNIGARQSLLRNRISLTLAISDVLETQRRETELDVAGVQQHVTTRRDSQVFYGGLTYHYGRSEKKEKDNPIPYEDQP